MINERTKRMAAGNRRLAKKRVQFLNGALGFVSSSVLADSLVLRNPLLRQAPKRYMQFPYSKTELFLAANEEIFTILDNQMVKN